MSSIDEPDDPESLQSKIDVYEDQLSQVEMLLSAEPDNEQFCKLRDDLVTLISMTKALLSAHTRPSTEDSSYPTLSRPIDGDVHVDAAKASNNDVALLKDSVQKHDVQAIPVSASLEASGSGPLGIGDVVLVKGGERPYAGYITDTVKNEALPGGAGVRVVYYEYPTTSVELPWSAVSRLDRGPVHAGNRLTLASPDWRGQCKYGPDQRYYSAQILELLPYGAKVIYPEFQTTEEVPLAYLRPSSSPVAEGKGSNPPPLSSAAAGSSAAAAAAAGGSAGSIPDKYRLLDSDSAEERRHKLKKIKAITHKNKELTKESEMAAVQHSWQKFVSKGEKRNLQGIKKTSIFGSGSRDTDSDAGGAALAAGAMSAEARKRHKI
jgi:hypothetical protein